MNTTAVKLPWFYKKRATLINGILCSFILLKEYRLLSFL